MTALTGLKIMLLCGILTAKDGKYRLKQAQKDMLKISATATENKLMLSIKAENISLKKQKNSSKIQVEEIAKVYVKRFTIH